jgi:hypothetical protein
MCHLPKVANAQYLYISREDREDIQKNGLDVEKYKNHTIIKQNSDKIELSEGSIVALRCDDNYELIGYRVAQCNKTEPVAKHEWPRCHRSKQVEEKGQ